MFVCRGAKDYDPVKMKALVGNKRSKRKRVSADVAGDWSYQRPRGRSPSACMCVYLYICEGVLNSAQQGLTATADTTAAG